LLTSGTHRTLFSIHSRIITPKSFETTFKRPETRNFLEAKLVKINLRIPSTKSKKDVWNMGKGPRGIGDQRGDEKRRVFREFIQYYTSVNGNVLNAMKN